MGCVIFVLAYPLRWYTCSLQNLAPAEGGATEYGGRRKMSESAVLALIREQSTSRDESENSSSQRGAVQRE